MRSFPKISIVIMLIIVAADARRYMNKYEEEDFLHLLDAIETFDERADTQETTNGKCINGKEMFSQGSVMCSAGFHNPQHNSDGDLSAERCNRECLNDAECQIATYLDIKKCYLVKGYGEIDCDEEETNRPDVMETFTKSDCIEEPSNPPGKTAQNHRIPDRLIPMEPAGEEEGGRRIPMEPAGEEEGGRIPMEPAGEKEVYNRKPLSRYQLQRMMKTVIGSCNLEEKEVSMKLKGNGNCKSGYYEGWDGKGTANQDACNQLCLSERQCTFAAYFNDGPLQTCSRYKDKSCILDTSNEFKRAHTTYYKELGAKDLACEKVDGYQRTLHGKCYSPDDNMVLDHDEKCAEIKREITRMYLNSVWRDRYCGQIFPQIDLQIDEMEEEEKEGLRAHCQQLKGVLESEFQTNHLEANSYELDGSSPYRSDQRQFNFKDMWQ